MSKINKEYAIRLDPLLLCVCVCVCVPEIGQLPEKNAIRDQFQIRDNDAAITNEPGLRTLPACYCCYCYRILRYIISSIW